MPILSLSEQGLEIDVFGSNPQTFPSEACEASNGRAVIVANNTIRLIDLVSSQVLHSFQVADFSEMKISKDGKKLAVMSNSGRVTLFNEHNTVFSIDNVEHYSISDNFLCIAKNTQFLIYPTNSNIPLFSDDVSARDVHAFNSFCVYFVVSKDSSSIILFKNGIKDVLLSRKQIFRMVANTNTNELSFTLLVDVEYVKNSYYAESALFLVLFGDSTVDEVNEPVLEKSTSTYHLFSYKLLRKIHFTKYLNDDAFYVCFGAQPANLHLYSLTGKFIKRFEKAVRNRAAISNNGSRILNAGLGNLPGNIEVFENGKTTCRFEQLGTSFADWLPDGTHFVLGTTDYLKTDNRIGLYDYHGRCINEKKYKSLNKIIIYGENEEPKEIKAPADKNITKKVEKYVPPHLAGNRPSEGKTAKPIRKPAQKTPMEGKEEPKREKRTKEELMVLIKEGSELKKRLADGEDIPVEDLRKVVNLKEWMDEYAKML